MTKDLLYVKNFGVFTFISTSQALKAERVMKEASAYFLIIPTPREISTSCGLAVKVTFADLMTWYEILTRHEVGVEGVYQVNEVEGRTQIERIING